MNYITLVNKVLRWFNWLMLGTPIGGTVETNKKVMVKMPEGWKPGRCIVEYDRTLSCPFSSTGCWVHAPINCPLNTEVKDAKPKA